jgi:hypothetical protein
MSELKHHAFFGDGEHDFLLTPEMIVELERKTVTGIGALGRCLFAGDFKHGDLIEVIRLGLIGGGTSPKDADALVSAYAINRPLSEIFPLSVAILERLWFGDAKAKE